MINYLEKTGRTEEDAISAALEELVRQRQYQVGVPRHGRCPRVGAVCYERGVEHGLQMSATHSLINVVAERFQVNVGSIKIRQQIL